MKIQNMIDANKLLADFVGIKQNTTSGYDLGEWIPSPPEHKWIRVDPPPFNKSWDWIMMVVDKLEVMTQKKYVIHTDSTSTRIYKNYNSDREEVLIHSCGQDGNSKIEYLHCALVRFIKQYHSELAQDKIAIICDDIHHILTIKNIEAKQYPIDQLKPNPTEILQHCAYMCEKIKNGDLKGKTNKMMRWLGFIQGALWSTGSYTIARLKDQNR